MGKVGNTICQRYLKSDSFVITTIIDIGAMVDGKQAGLTHFNGGKNYANIGVVQNKSVRKLKYEEDGKELTGTSISNTTIWFRSCIGFNDINIYQFSLVGEKFISFGGNYKLKWGNYRGDNIGIFNNNNDADSGYIDVDWFHYDIKNK